MLYKLSGACGSCERDYIARRFTVTLTGKYHAPVAAAATASPVYDSTDPVMGSGIGFELNSVNPLVSNLVCSDNGQIAERVNHNDDTGYECFMTTKHSASAAVTIEEDSTVKWEDAAVAGTAYAWTVVIGTVSGNILTTTGSKMQLGQPARDPEGGIQKLSMTCRLHDSAAGAKDWETITQT